MRTSYQGRALSVALASRLRSLPVKQGLPTARSANITAIDGKRRSRSNGKAFATKQVLQPEFDKLDRAFKNLGRAGGRGLSVKVTGTMPDLDVPVKPVEGTGELPTRKMFGCCSVVVRHHADAKPRFCITCGEEG
jgi:hypothetical protein